MRRTIVDPRFQGILVTLMKAAGISQNRLAKQASVSSPYISQIINGHRMPSVEVAHALDEALGAGGQLTNLVTLAARDDDLDHLAAAAANPTRTATSPAIVESLGRVLGGQRLLDDTMGSAALVGPVMAQMETVCRLVTEAAGPSRRPLLHVAGQWAQFAGWLHTSIGRPLDARTWFGRGLEWATEHGDADLIATIVSYQGHSAWLGMQWGACVGKAEAVLRDETVYAGQRAYDAFQAARGYAALADVAAAERMLERGNELAEAATAWTGEVPPWQYYRAPWLWAMERGLALLYISRHDRGSAPNAVAQLQAGVYGMPAEFRGADWAAEYLAHLATAHMYADDLDAAETVLAQARAVATGVKADRVLRMIRGREGRLENLRHPV